MNTQSPTFCVMPHMGLAIQNEGDMCACNINSQSYHLDGKRQTIDKITVDKIWDSPTRKEIADLLDSGIRNPGCQTCWQDEDVGITSSRQVLNEQFQHLIASDAQPKILIIKPGNSCNLACRMCRPETSSSWYRDSLELAKLKNPNLSLQEHVKDFEAIKNSFNSDSPNMWPVLNEWYKEIEFIDIYGGEPWMIPGLWTSLQTAIDNGYAKNISLQLHTNGSWYNDEYMRILSQFKSVRIGLSIDSHIKEELEYIRHKSKFEQIIENSKKFMEFAAISKTVDCYVCITITPINLWNLDEIATNLISILATKDYTIKLGTTNFVYDPTHYDIRHLPKAIKQIIVAKFSNNQRLLPVVRYMNQIIPGCVVQWPKFCLETEKLDKIRTQNFKTTFLEWYKVLEPYWDYKRPHHDWFGSS